MEDGVWSMSIQKLMIWRTGCWSRYDSKTINWTLRVAYDVLIIATSSKVFESLSIRSRLKGFYKGDILILIVSGPAQEARKIKFQIKGNVLQCLKKLGQHFPVLSHNSTSQNFDKVFESRFRNFEEVMKNAIEAIEKTGTLAAPDEFKDFVRVCLLDPIMPRIINDTKKVLEELNISK